VGEEFDKFTKILLERLQDLAEEENRNTETLAECSLEMSGLTSLGHVDVDAAKSIIRRSAKSLLKLADHYDRVTEPLDDVFRELNNLIRQDIQIRMDFDDPASAAEGNIEALRTLAVTLETGISQMDQLIASTNRLPKMSTEMNKAKNRLGKSRSRLRNLLVSFKEAAESAIAFYEERIQAD